MSFDLLPAEPEWWFVAFSRRSDNRLARWLSFGRYKHVRAFSCWPGSKIWVFFEVSMARTAIYVLRDGTADAMLRGWTEDCDILHVRRRDRAGLPLPPIYTCVTAVKHLLGLRSGALRPDRLWRDCLAAGAEIIHGGSADDPERPGRGCDQEAGRGGQDCRHSEAGRH